MSLECQWSCQYHHCIQYITVINMRDDWLFQLCEANGASIGIKWHHQWWRQLKHDDKAWHNCFGYMILLAPLPASHNTDGIVSGAILFVMPRWLNKVQHEVFSIMTLLALTSTSDHANATVNRNIAFIRSWWITKGGTWHLWSCDGTGASFSIMWSQWHHQ